MKKLILLILCLIPIFSVQSNDNYIHHTLFPSIFLDPQIASTYKIPREKNIAVITLALLSPHRIGGIKSKVSGYTANLLQQRYHLNFQHIEEKNASYYIAYFKFSPRDILNFHISMADKTIEFSKTMPK